MANPVTAAPGHPRGPADRESAPPALPVRVPVARSPGGASRSIGEFRTVRPTPVRTGGRHRRTPVVPERPLGRRILLVVGIVAVAVNLRCAVTSLGAVLGEVTRAWGFSGLLAGMLTALPVATFAVVGAAAPALSRRWGPERLVAAAMLAAAAGLTLRALTGSAALFLAGSALALAGSAIGNVLMPTLVKRYFPERIGAMTALYTTALAVGMTGGAALTGPAERAFGGDWRVGLGVWAGLALVAAPPWLALAGFAGRGAGSTGGVGIGGVGIGVGPGGARGGEPKPALHRASLARALTLFFGCQSLNAYVVLGWLPSVLIDAGRDTRSASLSLALVSAMSVPMSIALPAIAGRRVDQRDLVVLTTVCYAGGYLGLLFAPAALGWLSAALLGAGNGAFPLAVTLIGLRTRRPEMTTALSGLVQSGGYLLAVVGPLLVGVLHQVSGGWRVPLLVVLGTLVPQLLSGLRAARPGTVEAELLSR
ncbi:CynX/NimT family MFS transporter [Pseudonocardia sp. Cha107L01]|uniref:CynX/NimT family MFS transporter n=1 Tax=Pseudonocardia sp. Cha107L01 TaxID=3457576 RepID=UPI00403EB61A